MNQLTNPQFIKDLFRHYHLKPKDYLGQNFLIDETALTDIVDAAKLSKRDTVLEVGPGLGILTQQLAEKAGKVISVEKDQTLLPILKANLKESKNVELINKDILKFNLSEKIQEPYKVVANIPYYLTSFLFQYFLSHKNKPLSLTLLVQKEVGERVIAKPGNLSVLGISVQIVADAKIVSLVPKTSFWPQPKVDSVVLQIVPNRKYPEVTDEKFFFKLVKIGFAAKRKQLHNNFVSGLHQDPDQVKQLLEASGVNPKARAQDLSLKQWLRLYQTLAQKH